MIMKINKSDNTVHKKRLLFMCQYFYPETLSSAVLPYELACELKKNGFDVAALVGYPNEYLRTDYKVGKYEKVNGIGIQRLKYSGLNRRSNKGRLLNMISLSMSYLCHPWLIKKSDTLLCFTNPPVLPIIAALQSKKYHKKLAVVIYDLYPDGPVKLGYLRENSLIIKGFTNAIKKVFMQCSKIIVLSSEMKEKLLIEYDIDSDIIEIIPNWYQDCHKYLSYEPSFPLKIIYGGNMGEGQEMDTLLKTAKLLSDDSCFQFIFVGQGSQKPKIDSYIKDNKLTNCSSYDFLVKTKYDKLIEGASLSCLSLKEEIWGIGSPSKFYGYLAAKKPVIAIVPENTDIARDIKEYACGIHISIGDAEALVGFLKRCADDTDYLKFMSENAYKLFLDKYTLEKSTEKYEKILKSI